MLDSLIKMNLGGGQYVVRNREKRVLSVGVRVVILVQNQNNARLS